MKTSNKMLLVILTLSLLISCKKDGGDDDNEYTTPEGYWTGLYGNGSSIPSQNYAWLFRANGTVRVYSQSADTASASKAEGTYILSGQTITTSYTYFSGAITGSFSTLAVADGGFINLTGTYGSGSSNSGGGTFILKRKQ